MVYNQLSEINNVISTTKSSGQSIASSTVIIIVVAILLSCLIVLLVVSAVCFKLFRIKEKFLLKKNQKKYSQNIDNYNNNSSIEIQTIDSIV
jgi:Flp pilus assembly protein TadB